MMKVFTSTGTIIISMPQVQEASAMGIYKFGQMNYVVCAYSLNLLPWVG